MPNLAVSIIANELAKTLHAMDVVDIAIAMTVANLREAEDQRVSAAMGIQLLHMGCFEKSKKSGNPAIREAAERRYARHQAAAISWASR